MTPTTRQTLSFVTTVLLVILAAAPGFAQSVGIGSIQTAYGAVSIVRGSTTIPVNQGGPELRAGDTVRTGPNGRARIVTIDGKRATIGPSSSVTLGRGGGQAAWQISAGRAAIWVTGQRRTEVSAPGAVAAADGTGFEILVAEDGTTTLTVAEGTVDYYNDQGRVSVGANQQSIARVGQAPSRPAVVDAAGILIFEATVESLVLPLEAPPTFPSAPGSAGFRTFHSALIGRRSDLAGQAVRTLEQTSPNSAETSLAAGLFLLAQGRAADASPALQRASDLARSSGAGPAYLGLALFRQGNLKAAEAALRESIRRDASAHTAHAYLSSVLLASGQTAEAADAAKRAVQLVPESPLSREALGAALLFSGKPREAAVELRRSVSLDPLSPSAHLQLAKALAAADDLDGSHSEASRAVALDPNNASAHLVLGVLFMAARDADRGEREFRLALQISPNLAGARSGLGAVAALRGRFSQALKEQKAALELDSGSAQARNNLGVALTARGNLTEAAKELQEAIRLQPTYAVAHANLAIAQLELNDYSGAVRSAEKAVKLGDRSPFVRTTLARVFIRQRRYDRALAELRRSESLDPSYPLQHFYLAQLFRIQGRDRDSQRALFRGIALDPSTMVEQRLFARTEATISGGENGTIEANAKTDGRSTDGKFSYFFAGAHLENDGPRRNDDLKTDFTEGILGYQPNPRHNLALFSSFIDSWGGRPGRVTGSGPETPYFRSDLNGADLQLLERWQPKRGTALTVKAGYRRLSVLGHDQQDFFTLGDFRNREGNILAEARLDHRMNSRNAVVAGVSWSRSLRDFEGSFAVVPGPGVAVTKERTTPSLITAYLEWHRQLGEDTELLLGPYFGGHSDDAGLILPRFALRHRMAGESVVSLAAYPTFSDRYSDLRPVESWGRPIDIGRLGQDDSGWLMNYELTWQKPGGNSQLFTATGFYRRAHRLLVPIQDPDRAGLAPRAYFSRSELFGAEVAYERWLTSQLSGRLFGRFTETNSLTSGAELPYFARWASGARLDYLDHRGIRSSLVVHYLGDRRHIDFAGGPGRRVGGFFTADFRTEWQTSVKTNLFIEIRDILDRRGAFYDRFPTNGRTILGGIERRF